MVIQLKPQVRAPTRIFRSILYCACVIESPSHSSWCQLLFKKRQNRSNILKEVNTFLKQNVFMLLSFMKIRHRKQALFFLPPAYYIKQLKTQCEINNGNETVVPSLTMIKAKISPQFLNLLCLPCFMLSALYPFSGGLGQANGNLVICFSHQGWD